MKRLLLSITAMLAIAAVAMPTREEQKAAAPIVGELMNPLVADFRAKKKTAVEVGDSAMAYAKEANTEAAKFLLLKGAIWYYAQAKEDAKAVAAIAALGEQVKSLPPEVMRNDVLKPAIDHVSEQNVPGLFAQFRSASAQMEIAKLASSVKRNRADEPTRRRYAELLTVTGDWKAALDVFAKLDDAKTANAAKDEIGGKTLAPAGDFWWDYTPTEDTAAEPIKAHAVMLYRKAIASGELTGLKKVVAEKRIASVPFADRFNVSDAANVSAAPRGGSTPSTPSAKNSNAFYCVIDLSAGPTASKYPVKWLDAPPSGGFNTDEYKTTKLVLRRIEPGKFKMDGEHDVTLTKPYYMGVFEVTQKQYELVTGEKPSGFKGDMRPVEKVSYDMVRGKGEGAKWPTSSAVDSTSFMGKLRARTRIDGFDLPTEAQWEYACRAETTSQYNNGGDSEDNMKKLGRFVLNQKGRGHEESDANLARHVPDGKGGYSECHTVVGSYLPNAWGLYDMHGNVWERCLDWRGDLSGRLTDPVGSSSGEYRVRRGGSWRNLASWCASSFRGGCRSVTEHSDIGFRLCMNPQGAVGTAARGSVAPAASGKQPNALYCVIDLSAGPTASKYPVKWLDTPPPGGFNVDEYKTTKLVLRRIEPGTFKILFSNRKLSVTLTKPYYMGIFEMTQKQYELVTGKNPAQYKGAMRPVANVSWGEIRGDSSVHDWPTVKTVSDKSFVGILRARTSLSFDLPTEAQWASCMDDNGINDKDGKDWKKYGRTEENRSDGRGGYEQHTTVGSYLPNSRDLYDMQGNVREWCLDWWTGAGFIGDNSIDPVGPSASRDERQLLKVWGAPAGHRVTRSTFWNGKDYGLGLGARHHLPVINDVSMEHDYVGFRLCMNPEGPVGASAQGSAAPAASGK